MSSFGSFETEREVYSDLVYSVYTARKRDDPGGEYAIKVFRLPDHGLESEVAVAAGGRDELERTRLESITLQERAAADSSSIAPVLERGTSAQGLWYATRFYPRSVNKMMSGKVALPRASLEHIIRSIAQGALDFKRVCGRSHGDIRPTNVQVGKSEKLTEAEVVLCDPLPGGIEQAREYELSDLRAIGLILLELVRQRIMSAEDAALMMPISPGAEWGRIFGSDASDWLAICNRLLDPNLSPDQFTLESLVTRLDELRPKGGGSHPLVIAGAAAVLLVVAIGAWSMWPRGQTVQITSDPPGASLLVDQTRQAGTTPLGLNLKRGVHVIEARLDALGLGEQATNYLVKKGLGLAIHFQFPYGSVAVKSDPPGATILKDGARIGQTGSQNQPFTLSPVAPGPVKYQLSLDRYEPAEVNGVVSNHQRLELNASLRRSTGDGVPTVAADVTNTTAPPPVPANGVLELRAQPTQAVIFDADGHELGRASADTALRLTLPTGQHTLTARAEGLSDVTATLTVQPEKISQHTLIFDGGTVDWSTEPASATISFQGQSRIAPATFVQRSGVAASYVIEATGFQTVTNQVTVQRGEHKPVTAKLLPQNLTLELVSDPPGAEFLAENGSALAGKGPGDRLYSLPWGSVNLVARYGRLGAITNHFTLTPDQSGARLQFKFVYGTLVLTNLPAEIVVYEGETKVASAADQRVYEKPGRHVYALQGRANSQSVPMNIETGLNFLKLASAEKTWKNSLGMWFAWVPNLPGGGVWPGQSAPGGWVAISELTQGQYKKMDGSNPSFYQEGGDNYPVENVTREQAYNFCRWLSSADTSEHSGWRYNLPSDQQFTAFAADAERMARVTSEGRMPTAIDDGLPLQRLARLPTAGGANAARTHAEPVASTRQPNQYGLYDVIGNVWEWLDYPAGKDHPYAGGSYLNFSPKTLVAKAREHGLEKGPNIGFRVILVPAP